MKKVFFCLAAFISLFWISSCDVGLGEVVDIEAPELTLRSMTAGGVEKTNFGTTLYTRAKVTFKGEAWDNVSLDGVYAEVKWLGDEDYHFLKDASVNGNEWRLDIDFGDKEGACWLKIVSADKKKNYGSKSAKVVSLFVDEKAPVGDAWYIDRLVSGIQYSLQTKETLKEIISKDPELLQPSNIDVAQNGEFKICSSFSDASGISTVSISIWDENNNKIGVVEKTTDSSNYAPQFLISKTTVSALPPSGIHYLQVRYNASDIVADPSPNNAANEPIDMGWFIWWPESDNPRCYISQEDSSKNIKLHINDSLNVTIFDDDGFSSSDSITCTLYEENGTTVSKDKNNNPRQKSITPANGQRECNIVMTVPGEAQKMILKASAKDMNGKTLAKNSTVLVTDENHPTLIITAPENNQVPSVTGTRSNITFKGITLDSSGCTNLKFVWVPDSVQNKKEKAVAWLSSDETVAPNSAVEVIDGTGDYVNLQLYNVKLSATSDEGGLKKQEFEFTRSLTNDFGTDINKDKYFYIRLIRKDGNYTDTELKLAADNIKPEIKLTSPSGNMAIIDKDDVNGLVMKFYAEKSNGVAIDKTKYKIEYIPQTGDPETVNGSVDDTGYKSATISNETLKGFYESGKNPRYKLYAEDILGNKNDATFEFIISSLPQISSISSSASPLCKAKDDILINVSFTKPVSISDTTNVKLKLANIKNGGSTVTRSADYYSGEGSTTLVFKYTVQAGDTSDKLQVNNENGVGPIEGLAETTAHLKVLPDGANLQDKKTIKIDGVAPKISAIGLTTDVASANGIDYLKEGKTITATVTVDKKVTVQGAPKFKIGNLSLTWQAISYPTPSSSMLTFSKKIVAGENQSAVSVVKASCISSDDLDYIKDEAGNSLSNPLSGNGTQKIVVDTASPAKPEIHDASVTPTVVLTEGKYMTEVRFKITNVVQSADPQIKAEYSIDGGTTWVTYSDFGTTNATAPAYNDDIKATSSVVYANLVAKITDRAGNVSAYSDPISLEVNNAFPAYTVECTDADKNYKSGKLTFKVYFDSPVNIPSTSAAYITLSGKNSGDVFGSNTHNAVITSESKKNNVSEATFEYTIQNGDSFTLKVAKDAVHLINIKDLYGFEQKSLRLDEDYERENLKVDNIPPKVVTMKPAWRSSSNKRQITLEFSENVQVNTGKIYVRQKAGWAIPPVLTVSEFNEVINAVKAAGNTKIGSLTGTEILYMDGKEDSGQGSGSKDSRKQARNNKYYGTGQYIGPYKVSSHGITGGNPDTTTKYVLAYDLDIWGTNGAKFGVTYDGNGNLVEAANNITTGNIRQVLESIHFHERSMSVNSSSVIVDSDDRTKVTLNIPNGFLGDTDLPKGREWELVIEKGAFMDETGNLFGYEADGTMEMSDSRQATNNKTATTSAWERQRNTVASNAAIQPLVLIQDGENASFLSSGVETPVIRVDRYSFGIGMKQPSLVNDEIYNTAIADAATDTTTVPTAKIRVRIDCETPGASIYYTQALASNYFNYESSKVPTATAENHGDIKAGLTPALNADKMHDYHADFNINWDTNNKKGDLMHSFSYWTESDFPTVADPTKTGAGDSSVKFLGGNGDYEKSCKQIIKAKAWLGSSSSDVGMEGIFQTVLHIVGPMDGNLNLIGTKGDGKKDFSVRGTTGWAGEPSITPFPLRDAVPQTPYLRRAYRVGNDYYWISYELLVGSSFSGHCSDGGNYEWTRNWGYSEPGEFTRCINLERW